MLALIATIVFAIGWLGNPDKPMTYLFAGLTFLAGHHVFEAGLELWNTRIRR